MPAMPHSKWLRTSAYLRRLEEIARSTRIAKAGDDRE
jgi:UDP-3-O-[3-hydroxymyristoyl] glucosamine N-acyltransferase